MSLYITSLNSGSNGNCYYVGNKREAVLIDAGISCREIENRLANNQIPISNIKAVFVSHEHIDHIRGVETLSRKHQIKVYISNDTLKHSGLDIDEQLVQQLDDNTPLHIGKLNVVPFSKFHDAADPYSFVVESNGIKVGVFTDIGTVCKKLIHYFKQCHACFLESNYDEQMLEEGNYPLHLKRRIRSGNGHLSNRQSYDLFFKHRLPYLSHLILSHLSENNNRPEIALQHFAKHADDLSIKVASRFEAIQLLQIKSQNGLAPIIGYQSIRKPVQLSMFEKEV